MYISILLSSNTLLKRPHLAKRRFYAGMAEVQIVTTDKNATDLADGGDVESNKISVNSQPETESKPRGLVGSITFDSTQAEKGGVDPAELVGKVFVNAYHISSKPEDGLPASYGIAFTDGSRYHVRIHGRLVSGDSSRVAIDIDEDDLAGKQVTSASLLRYEGHFLNIYDFIGVRSHGLRAYVALGIKVEGTDSWIKFFGSEDDYNSDAGITVDDYCDVYLVKMKRGPVKKGRSKKY